MNGEQMSEGQLNDAYVKASQTRPSIARAYHFLLGEHEYYSVDQTFGQYFLQVLPGSERIATTNRRALERAVRDMAGAGIRQFIDFGCGLPTSENNVHEIARRVQPTAGVVYLDNDPIVVAHADARLVTDERIAVMNADVRQPRLIGDSAEVERLINFDEPVGLIFGNVLAFVNDEENPTAIVQYWVERLASGSLVYISHFLSADNPQTSAAEEKLQGAFSRGRWRGDKEILRMLSGLEVLEPGLVPCVLWRNDEKSAAETTPWEQLIASVLARKP